MERKKVFKNQNKKDNVIKVLLILLLTAIIFVSIFYIEKLNSNNLEEHTFYQYIGGQKQVYQGVLEITKKHDITSLVCKDFQVELDSTPIYYNDEENKVLFPEDMAIVYPVSNGQMKKINRFSVCYKEGESTYIQVGEQKKLVENAFLFDGQDIYFFLQDTILKIGDEEYRLSPLSYVFVSYNQFVEIYQKQEDLYKVVNSSGKTVEACTDSYVVDLNVDVIKYEQKEQLLLKNISALQNV